MSGSQPPPKSSNDEQLQNSKVYFSDSDDNAIDPKMLMQITGNDKIYARELYSSAKSVNLISQQELRDIERRMLERMNRK